MTDDTAKAKARMNPFKDLIERDGVVDASRRASPELNAKARDVLQAELDAMARAPKTREGA